MRIITFLLMGVILVFSVFSNDSDKKFTHLPGTNIEIDVAAFQYNRFANGYYTNDRLVIMTTAYERIGLAACIEMLRKELVRNQSFIVDEERYINDWKYLLIYHAYNIKFCVLFVGDENETTLLKALVNTALAEQKTVEKITEAYKDCRLSKEPLNVKDALSFDISLPDSYQFVESDVNVFKFKNVNQNSANFDTEIVFRGVLYNEKIALQEYLLISNSKDEEVLENKKIEIPAEDHLAWFVSTRDNDMRMRYKYVIVYKKYVLVVVATIPSVLGSAVDGELSAIVESIRFII